MGLVQRMIFKLTGKDLPRELVKNADSLDPVQRFWIYNICRGAQESTNFNKHSKQLYGKQLVRGEHFEESCSALTQLRSSIYKQDKLNRARLNALLKFRVPHLCQADRAGPLQFLQPLPLSGYYPLSKSNSVIMSFTATWAHSGVAMSIFLSISFSTTEVKSSVERLSFNFCIPFTMKCK